MEDPYSAMSDLRLGIVVGGSQELSHTLSPKGCLEGPLPFRLKYANLGQPLQKGCRVYHGCQPLPQELPEKSARAILSFGSDVRQKPSSFTLPISDSVKDVWEDAHQPPLVQTHSLISRAVWKGYQAPGRLVFLGGSKEAQ